MQSSIHRFISYFFFSNIFLGVTALALCIETNLLSNLTLNYAPFYLVIFLGTCLYYTMIYVRNVKTDNFNERTIWYRNNLPYILTTLKFIMAGLAMAVLIVFIRNGFKLFSLTLTQNLLLLLFPLLAGWYTFSPRIMGIKNIRQFGMLKPFVIGLTWSGFVTVYPVIIWQLQKAAIDHQPMYPSFWLWLQNFLFISILAIIFDIKDYRSDTLHHLTTFPVMLGIKKTMLLVAFPLFIVNLIVFGIFQTTEHFTTYQTLVQTLPYVLLVLVIFQHTRPKSILYYLAGIDGLMLLKALCGISVVLFLKK